MDYKQKYEQALEYMCKVYPTLNGADKEDAEHYFPELKESEDERIRKAIVNHLLELSKSRVNLMTKETYENWIAWLEKQGEHANFRNKIQIGDEVTRNEDGVLVNLSQFKRMVKQRKQKPADKVEPKFKVGDFIINEYGFIMQIDGIDGNMYVYHVLYGNILLKHDITKTEESCHLWTIQDAEDGDVLATDNGGICIFDGTVEEGIYPFAYCGLTRYGFEFYDRKLPFTHDNNVYPATKEQRDLLFQKMKEAGYEWDAEKKELKKIEQKPAWSKENICYYDDICEILINLINSPKSNVNKDVVQKDLDWLRSVKESQLKPVWSEEDEMMLNHLIDVLYGTPSARFIPIKREIMIPWLKSLKERMKGE